MYARTWLVLFASEQIVPNLESILHYWRRGSLAGVYILHRDNEQRSGGPARRLAKLLRELRQVEKFKLSRPVEIIVRDRPVGITPQEIGDALNEIFRQRQVGQWVVNVTGGLKMMTLGVAGLAAPDPIEIIYQERDQGWFLLETHADGKMFAHRYAGGIEHDISRLIDDIPVDILIQTQFRDGDQFKFPNLGKPRPLDVAAAAEKARKRKWNWSSIAEPGEDAGTAYERFICGAVARMGIGNLVRSLRIESPEGKQRFQEVDLVLCKDGIVSLADISLTSVRAKYQEIRDASETGARLGGINTRVILFRPNWEFTEANHAFAKAYRVTLVDRAMAASPFTTLAQLIGGKLDANLRAADKIFAT